MLKYHTILGKHKGNSEPVEDHLCSAFDDHKGKKYHRDVSSGKFVIVDCGSEQDFLEAHSELTDLVPNSYPAWMTNLVDDPLNMSREEARLLSRHPSFINRSAL